MRCSHSVISISTYSAILSSPDAQRDQFRTNRPNDAKGSWFMSILKTLGFFGLVAALLYAYKTYALRQTSGRGFSFGKSAASIGGGLYADSKRF